MSTCDPPDHPQSPSAAHGAFEAAFLRLMRRAPGPVFPRARRLYFDKYALEGQDSGTPYRTHLLEETIEEGSDGSLLVQASIFALVPAAADQSPEGPIQPIAEAEALAYLQERWQQSPSLVTASEGPWFRTNRAYLRVALAATYNTRTDREEILNDPGS